MKQRIIQSVYPSRLAHEAMQLASPLSTVAVNRLADAFRQLDIGTTERLRDSYSIAFPHLSAADIEEIVKKNWRSRFQAEHERVQLNGMPREQLISFCRSNVETIGAEHLRAACESPEPIVFFTPHYGSFAVACLRAILDVEQHKTISLFYDPPEVSPTTAMYKGLIERMGCNSKILLNDRTAVLKGLRALKGGNALGIMPDVYEFSPGLMFVPFFGRLTIAMGGTAFFALKSNARLIPVYCYRRARSRFVLQYGAPIELSRTGNFDRDIYRTTARIFANMQEQLTARPEHWVYWESLLDRFAYTPEVELPVEGESWDERFSVLRETLAEEHSQLGKFLASFETRLRRGNAKGGAGESKGKERKAVVNG
jgi:KDO2-lipid IV(A) lauroyltransferase